MTVKPTIKGSNLLLPAITIAHFGKVTAMEVDLRSYAGSKVAVFIDCQGRYTLEAAKPGNCWPVAEFELPAIIKPAKGSKEDVPPVDWSGVSIKTFDLPAARKP